MALIGPVQVGAVVACQVFAAHDAVGLGKLNDQTPSEVEADYAANSQADAA
jgi:hypothetical protein